MVYLCRGGCAFGGVREFVCLPNNWESYGQILGNFQQILKMPQGTDDYILVIWILIWIQEFFLKEFFIIALVLNIGSFGPWQRCAL